MFIVAWGTAWRYCFLQTKLACPLVDHSCSSRIPELTVHARRAQRGSVIAMDAVLISGAWFATRREREPRRSLAFFLVVANAGLLLVDHIHFQYNGLLLGALPSRLVALKLSTGVLPGGRQRGACCWWTTSTSSTMACCWVRTWVVHWPAPGAGCLLACCWWTTSTSSTAACCWVSCCGGQSQPLGGDLLSQASGT